MRDMYIFAPEVCTARQHRRRMLDWRRRHHPAGRHHRPGKRDWRGQRCDSIDS